mmetsp:Transcript_42836/g.128593  ORF Transcript_42836/g.128593 Transcript_42836/m.128593 type:complete len:263 (-) Transcript_42836:151-939(-)
MLFIGVVLARGVDTAAGAAAAVLAYFLQNASSCVSADSTVPEGTKAARARKLPRYAAAMQRAMSGTPVVDVARDSSSAISDSERHGGPSAAEPNTKNWVNLQRAVGSTRRSNNDSRHAHTSDALPIACRRVRCSNVSSIRESSVSAISSVACRPDVDASAAAAAATRPSPPKPASSQLLPYAPPASSLPSRISRSLMPSSSNMSSSSSVEPISSRSSAATSAMSCHRISTSNDNRCSTAAVRMPSRSVPHAGRSARANTVDR